MSVSTPLLEQLAPLINEQKLYQAVLSSPLKKGEDIAKKVTVRPIQLKEGLVFQFEYFFDKKVLHKNVSVNEVTVLLNELITTTYKQTLIKAESLQLHILTSKQGKVTVKRKGSIEKSKPVLEHNRAKMRIFEEGKPIAFLVELGIMTNEGKVHAKKQDKFRQINRFIEMVDDVVSYLPKQKRLKIIDFGCGKSYLTFALYHYLAIEHRYEVDIIGLDLKKDVIAFCNDLASKLKYNDLRFLVGDIAEYNDVADADMIVTLHACNTATDAAIGKAVQWGASVIMSVPCCQHELFPQIEQPLLSSIVDQGLLKERFSALATDGMRGQLLEVLGYKVQMLEFIDPEHTPKNLMIRAVKPNQLVFNKPKWESYKQFRDFLGVSHTLEHLLKPYIKSE